MSSDSNTVSAEADLRAERMPLFAGAWLGAVALITAIETVQRHFGLRTAATFVGVQLAIVGIAVAVRAAKRPWVVFAVCGALAASTAVAFASAGASGDILGVLMFTLAAGA